MMTMPALLKHPYGIIRAQLDAQGFSAMPIVRGMAVDITHFPTGECSRYEVLEIDEFERHPDYPRYVGWVTLVELP